MFSLIACCQELTVSYSGNDSYFLTNYDPLLDSNWTSSGVTNGIDHYLLYYNDYVLEEHVIWFVDKYWIMGSVDGIGTTSYFYMYAESSMPGKAVGKCPNNQGSIKWNWAYIDQQGNTAPANDFHIKCASEGDFCTSTNPCGSEQGDCDIHEECQTGLSCGLNNCGLDEDPEMDCCYAATIGDDTFCTTVNNNDPSCLLSYFSIIFNLLLTFFEFLSQFLTCR